MRLPALSSRHSSRSHASLENDREFRTCLCVHVRTGTLLLGLFHMLLQVVIILATLLLIIHPNVMQEARKRYQFVDTTLHMFPFADTSSNNREMSPERNGPATMKPSNMDNPLPLMENIDVIPHRGISQAKKEKPGLNDAKNPPVATTSPLDRIHPFKDVFGNSNDKSEPAQKREISKRGDRLWTVSLTALFLFFTGLLVHGVLYRRPAHLLPYFSLQVFDFVLACLTVMGYMTYLPDSKNREVVTPDGGLLNDNRQSLFPQNGEESRSMPLNLHYRNWERVDAGTRLAYMSLAFLMLALKAYLMGMVWACYKYLIMWHRMNATVGTMSAPSDLREALHDMWSHMRRPVSGVIFTWLPRGLRPQTPMNGESHGLLSGVEDEEAAHLVGAEGEAGAEQPPTEPPNYDELLKQPANANMPPPYFKVGNASSEVEDPSAQKK